MEKATIIKHRTDLISTGHFCVVSLGQLRSSIEAVISENEKLAPEDTRQRVGFLIKDCLSLNELFKKLAADRDHIKQLAEKLLEERGISGVFFRQILRKNPRSLRFLVPTATGKACRDILVFNENISRLHEVFSNDVQGRIEKAKNDAEPKTITLELKEASKAIEQTVKKFNRLLKIEDRNIDKSTKITPAEVRVAKWGAYSSIILALITTTWAALEQRANHNRQNEESKNELYSEYRIRLGEVEKIVFAPNSTNMLSDKYRRNVMSLIGGGYALTKDKRTEVSWERIIRDLQNKYAVKNNASNAVAAVLNLKEQLAEPCASISVTTNIDALRQFAETNGFY
jgi:hypothetical protein